ncbi:MAG TPA: hypothetical protein VFA71_08365 [Terriglobales bacterium]|nr:hypothetical protein [Terriglobales bacterium]
MEKTPDYGRIMAILYRRGQPTNEDLAWINHYLELADKYQAVTDKTTDTTPPVRSKAKKQSA